MKKTLLFIGLAMCGTFAFAQSNNYNAKMDANNLENVAISMRMSDIKPADYRASIFAKDDSDTIYAWHFNAGAADMPTVYGTAGRVGAGEMVNGQALEVNTITRKCATWQHIADTHSFVNASDFASTYTVLSAGWFPVFGYMVDDLGDNGMMLMSMIDFSASDGFPNAYMAFEPKPRGNAAVIMVAINQEYRKYYDQCWVDYKINGAWKTREVNVTGVDLDVNDWGAVHTEYAMPLELATQTNIEIRVRYSGTSRQVSVHGYFWAIGDIAIIGGSENGWRRYGQNFVDGAYGTVPNGMQFPFTWLSEISNMGTQPRTNVTAHVNHIDAEGNVNEVLSYTMPGSMAAGDPSVTYPIYINERGFLNANELDGAGYLLYASNYGNAGLPAGCQGRGLPATTNGLNRFQVCATSPNADPDTLYWPYMPYRVVPNTNNPANSNLELGYRWGHDNGIIPTGRNYNASYIEGIIVQNNHQYITDSGNFGTAGYWMALRYTTPNTIPTTNGEPWRLLGIEIIPSTEVSADQLNNTRISLMAYRDVYDYTDSTVSMESVNTGVNGLIYTLNGEDISNELDLGYIKADAEGDYNAVTVFFPEQPELLPNTSYRLGYQLQEDGLFAVAGTRNNTAMETEDGLAYVNFDSMNVAGVTGYGRNLTPNTYDLLLYDPMTTTGNSLWASYYSTQFPMIRAIVGPAREVPQHYLTMDCGQGQAIIEYADEDVCGEEVQVAEGSSPVIYIFAGNDHRVLDKLYIDGVEIVPNTGDNIDGDPNFYTDGDDNIWDTVDGFEYLALERNYWSYRFINLEEDHVIRVTSHEVEWNPAAVDAVAADVRMVLAPNPATSQVAMVLKGVTGMVNCNIIDMSGRVVYSSTLNAERQNNIDLSNVPAGAYFVRINNDSFVKVEKLIVR